MKRLFLKVTGMILVTLAISGCQTASQTQSAFSPGMKFQNQIQIGVGGQQIPLPDGEWEVAATDLVLNNNSTPIQSISLFQQKDSHLSKVIYVRTPLDVKPNGYVQSSYCSRDDMHFRETTTNNPGGQQDCRWVNNWRLTLKGNKRKMARDAGEYLEKAGISYPNHLIQSGYRLADSASFLDLYYFVAPDQDGFEDYARTTWNDSPWHPQNVYRDAKKEAYINKIKTWTNDWYSKVKAGRSGSLPKVAAANKKPSS